MGPAGLRHIRSLCPNAVVLKSGHRPRIPLARYRGNRSLLGLRRGGSTAQVRDQGCGSISPGRQVLSNQGCSGPYSRNNVFQPLPGLVCNQLASLPAGAFGPK